MKRELKHNANSRRQAECSCSIPEKAIANLASWAVEEGKETDRSNLVMAAHTGPKLQRAALGVACRRTDPGGNVYRSKSYHRHTNPLKSRKPVMATACRSLHEGLALNIVEGLSADNSDYWGNLTSGGGTAHQEQW